MAIGRYIKSTIKTMIKWAVSDDNRNYPSAEPPTMSMAIGSGAKSSSRVSDTAQGLNFVVFPATGGKVVQFTTYDPRTDRHSTSLYVVTDKEDLGDELGQIITKESLCR